MGGLLIYVYYCQKCDLKQEVHKPLSQIDEPEQCVRCLKVIERQIQPIKANKTAVFESHFNHGLGKVVTSHIGVKEELARLRGETGKDIVEVGTDDLKSIKKKRQKY